MKLNLGCGQKPIEGFIGVDKVKTDCTDVVQDLFTFPWPFEDNSVDEIRMIHFFEHVPAKIRMPFLAECWRIMKPGAVLGLSVPAYNSQRYYQDFTHEWPPVVPASFNYVNKAWREREGLTHGDYDIKANFEIAAGANITEEWKHRPLEAQEFAAEHYWNCASDIVVNLTKLEM